MKKILWIDDEVNRFSTLGKIEDALVIFALGFSQIDYYLNKSGIKFDLIILDHDMQNHMDGREVCKQFLVESNIPVVICSNNSGARIQMLEILEEYNDNVYKYPVVIHDISWPGFRHLILSSLGML